MPIVKYSSSEQVQINAFTTLIEAESQNGYITKVYRGDKVDKLFERMNIHFEPSNPDWQLVLERLFMIGEKSQHFYSKDFNDYSSTDIVIEDVSDILFSAIFDLLNVASKNKRSNQRTFFKRNSKFKAYFQDKSNLSSFLEIIRDCNEKERFGIKNYYLTLVHQLGVVGYKSHSQMISTSTSKLRAIQFASFKRTNPWYIIHAWTPRTNSLIKVLEKSNLPKYDRPPFFKQQEISFFAGLLPHYIIGIHIMGVRAMIYNPAIFSSWIDPTTMFTGLTINQNKFDEVASSTAVKGKFVTDGEDLIQISLSN